MSSSNTSSNAITDENSMQVEDTLTINEIIQKNVSKNVRDLQTYLSTNGFIREKGDRSANIINRSGGKLYDISTAHIEKFFTLLDGCRKEKLDLHYLEKQTTSTSEKSGIMIDFDHYQFSKDKQITSQHYELLTRYLTKLLCKLIDFSDYSTTHAFHYHIFYISRPAVTLVDDKKQKELGQTKPVFKDGFHVLIPELQVSKGLKKYLLQELERTNIVKNTFEELDHIGDINDILDYSSASNPVHFLGNSKIGNAAYPLTHAFKVTVYTNDDTPDIDRKVLNVEDIHNGLIDGVQREINLTYELSLGFYVEKFNGAASWLRKVPMDYRVELETKIQLLVEKSSNDILNDDDILNSESSVDILTIGNAEANHIKSLLGIIDISYATEYSKWFKVICAIAQTNRNYKPLAVWFSHRKPESWSATEIDRVWEEATAGTYKGTPITKRSLIYWARTSSPQRFKELENENYRNILARGAYADEGRVEHALAAKVCHSMISDKFVVDVGLNEQSGKRGYCWYEFVMPGQSMCKGEIYKWRQENDPDNIHLFIGEQMPKVYAPLLTIIKDLKAEADNDRLTKYWSKVESNFRLSKSRLGNNRFQKDVIDQAKYRFRSRGFYEGLDKDKNVCGVGNGVLLLGKDKNELITGFHEYKVSKFTETDYIPYDPENIYIKEVLSIIRDIYPEPDVSEFMLFHGSTALDGHSAQELLFLNVGGGQNGKTTFMLAVHSALGNQYSAAGKPSLLVNGYEKGESANSAQMQMRGKRYFYFDEFNDDAVLNPARVKSVVNAGWQSGRDLHEKQTNFENECNPIAVSNYLFQIFSQDHGMWRRIYLYNAKCKFLENPNKENPYEKKVDYAIQNKLKTDPRYKEAVLSILAHYHQRLMSEYGGNLHLIPVPTIRYETEVFRNSQDSLNRFITQMIVESPGADKIGLPMLASKYISWHNETIKKNTNLTIQAVIQSFENSRVSAQLKREESGVQYLHNHRIKESVEEKPLPNETALCAPKVTLLAHQPARKTPMVRVGSNDENDDLQQWASDSNFIQTREYTEEDDKEIIDAIDSLATNI